MASFAVKSLDHVVLTAKDIDATVKFYTTKLGMKHETFASDGIDRYSDPRYFNTLFQANTSSLCSLTLSSQHRHALRFGSQKINLHLSGKEFEPKARHVQPGSADLCFITDHPIDEVLSGWQSAGIEVLEGGKVVERTGAVGNLRSVYCRDPDGNLIE
ncbi:hypothetical protein LTR91_014676 [Friedmanniomyces endolithicus]|uniref:VOC domain-containing protein n=1 Tax=Friedmanniomyces endolithicus TaxID=329885 RepID=A0AAN6KBN6_9PEZI|nr:hypothetical protein LTS09_005406 [Friedmanniomyces endolithicus]KAK0267110.1 hypothetical protein LTR35_016595 [Friedmanniomyces endolithicus]KAK0285394.1 hypothetical protein LTS00_011024 [Friedmanniomyces endolithicus]KAK0309511.1 hypothetical protein LTR01_004619 [Friedmanniomyces endolithicus]KAK0322550.1 hypothetical protein LTR82_006510 [Friedmanniomyces endolithicus]